MIEKIPENQDMRDAIAGEIKRSRREEHHGPMVTDREGYDYISQLEGVEAMFDYVKGLSSQTILDIGTGSARGAHELAESPMGQGLRFEATGLWNDPAMKEAEAVSKIHLTPAETLRGIPDNSIGGILAVFSISYAAIPEAAIKRMDEVLVPGGVIKATFPAVLHPRDGLVNKPYDAFEKALEAMEYDIALNSQITDVLTAIKKGGSVKAFELMKKDIDTYRDQLKKVPNPQGYI